MNWTIFRSMLELRRTSLLWYSFGIAAYGWMMVAFFPLIAANLDYMDMMMDVFTDELMAILGAAGTDFTTLGGFMGVEYLNMFWVFIVAAAVIMFAAGALGGAVDEGTMELTLSQPVSRMEVAVSRFLALAAYAGALNLVTAATLYLPGLVHGVDVPLDAMALFLAAGWLVTMSIGSFAFLVSAVASAGNRAAGVSFGVIAAMWLLDTLGTISERFGWLSNLSLFHYWNPADIIDNLTVAPQTWAVFGIATSVFAPAAIWLFRRRDVA